MATQAPPPVLLTPAQSWIIDGFSADEVLLTKDKDNIWSVKKGLTTKPLTDFTVPELVAFMPRVLNSQKLDGSNSKLFIDTCIKLKADKEFANSRPAVFTPATPLAIKRPPAPTIPAAPVAPVTTPPVV
jgi:hypothetical protein